jgi:hypothetical protein
LVSQGVQKNPSRCCTQLADVGLNLGHVTTSVLVKLGAKSAENLGIAG